MACSLITNTLVQLTAEQIGGAMTGVVTTLAICVALAVLGLVVGKNTKGIGKAISVVLSVVGGIGSLVYVLQIVNLLQCYSLVK